MEYLKRYFNELHVQSCHIIQCGLKCPGRQAGSCFRHEHAGDDYTGKGLSQRTNPMLHTSSRMQTAANSRDTIFTRANTACRRSHERGGSCLQFRLHSNSFWTSIYPFRCHLRSLQLQFVSLRALLSSLRTYLKANSS